PGTVSCVLRIVGQAHSEWHRHLCVVFPVPSLVGLEHHHEVTRIFTLNQVNVFDARTLRPLRTTRTRIALAALRTTLDARPVRPLRTTLTLRPRRPLRTSLALLALVARRAIHAVNAIFTARTPRAALTLRAALAALTLRPWRTLLPRRTWRENARRAAHLLHLAGKFLRRRVILVGQLVQLGALSLATPHIPRHTQHDQ